MFANLNVAVHQFCPPVPLITSIGEIGCALSHTKLMEHIAKQVSTNSYLADKWFIVLEDDSMPTVDAKKLKNKMLKILQSLPKDYKLLLLGSCYDDFNDKTNIILTKHIWAIDSLCLHAYAIKGGIANYLYNLFNENLCTHSVDVLTQHNKQIKKATYFKKKYDKRSPLKQFNDSCGSNGMYFCQGLFAQKKDRDGFQTNILKNSAFLDQRHIGYNDQYNEY